MRLLKWWVWIASSLFILILAACGAEIDTGTLSLSLSDTTTTEYKAVYVTIEEVQVHKDGDENEDSNWEVVASPRKTYNLLELVNGVIVQLGITHLETGHYTQMRLIIGESPDADTINLLGESHPYANYIIDNTDIDYYELKIPSGLQTGIKIVHGFDINEDQTTELILDFDASRSIVRAGKSGQWLLKPTIKVLDTAEYAIISGTVTAIDAEGVLVSAQVYDSGAEDTKDEVVVEASTITDEGGSYKIFLHPGTYNLVAYREGYNPECVKIVAASNTSYTENFALSAASTGTVSSEEDVLITDGGSEQHVTLSFRQTSQCGGSSEAEQIEVKSLNIANGGDYSVSLPEGTYSAVASTYGKETNKYDIEITADTDTTLDITF